MDKTQEVKEWFDIADDDLRAAVHLLTLHHPRPDNIICNLCQQAAEKLLKGFLVYKEIELKKTHDLVALLELAKANNADISVLLDKCTFLFQFAVIPRYPNQHEYTEEEVQAAIQYAKEIQGFIKGLVEGKMNYSLTF
ncbi:MAG: HEPN domain-containing protein [Spirochaetaceae bacterium]|jgi:HEPN domain-containing protein|nr:HEPN domain-containing protein [Spirochaetaceae bacterium]